MGRDRSVTRRSFLRGSVVVGGASLLAACAPGAAPVPVQPTPPPTPATTGGARQYPINHTPSGTLTWAGLGVAATMDPHNQSPSINDIGVRMVFDALLTVNKQGEVVPVLAESYRNIDTLTWEFKLRPGVTFASGRPVTAEAVQWNFERVNDVANRLFIRSRIPTYEKTEIVDATTVRFKTVSPDPIWPRRMLNVVIADPAEAARLGADFSANPGPNAGSGLFRMTEFESGNRIVLEASRGWRGTPRLQRVVLRAIPDPAAIAAGLRTGEVDLAYLGADQAEALQRAGLVLVRNPQASVYEFWVQTTKGGPLGDRRVRLAMNHAVDRDAIVKNLYGGAGTPLGQRVGSDGFGFNPNLRPYAYDPARARQLLAEAGYAGGFETSVDLPIGSAILTPFTTACVGYWNEIGIRVQQLPSEVNVFQQRVLTGDGSLPLIAIGTQYGPAMDADFTLNWASGRLTPAAAVRYDNPEFDQVLAASRQEFDTDKRRALLQRALEILHNDAATIPIMQPQENWLHTPRVRGFVPHPTSLGWVDWQDVAVS